MNLICHRFASVVLAVAGLVVVPTAVIAQQAAAPVRAKTEKLMLSFSLAGVSLDSDEFEEDPESGGGFSAQVGWGFNRRFTLLADASAAVLNPDDEEFVLIHFDLLGRFNFVNPQRPLVPFLEGGITARVAGQDDIVLADDGGAEPVDLEISGGGFTLGGGLQYHVAPSVSFGASLRFTFGEFSTVKINNVSVEDVFELDATSTRLNIGVTWWPLR